MITIKDVEKMDCLTITPAIAGEVLGIDPQNVRLQARNNPQRLGFPVICYGSRVKIPREPFVRFVRYGKV